MKQPEKNRSNDKMAAPIASVHPVRNRLRYNFFLYQTNEVQMLPRLNGHFMNALVWFCM